MERKELLQRAPDTLGAGLQSDLMIEEMSELAVGLLKLRRAQGDRAREEAALGNVREEMVDVQIMLDQMKLMFGYAQNIEDAKLARLQERLNVYDAREGGNVYAR